MIVSEIATKMIEYSKGNLHDINHFLKVYAYAKIIGECEKLDKNTQTVLEVAAIVHDIACPLCRKKYGNTNGKYQEKEGKILVAEFLKDTGYSEEFINHVIFLVGHHHTPNDITGLDYQILIEADYIVNADESNYSKGNINNAIEKIFKTATGIALLRSIYAPE
ncbi:MULTISPECIES: HD domain-containing protein [Clostridium]|uniref:HD domain-containing protein n=1 Tax=Clostridium TaxID=1485 RepID=UPI000825794A|nr:MULTISPECIES: HD domain-containing protein [Clostridium]PJI08573.1 HD domain-containing protein [Clostridium sp. CT7]